MDRTSAVRSGIVWSVLDAELHRRPEPPTVLDVGGGSGVLAVPLAELGCDVTVVDTSADALATLRRRAEEAGAAARVRGLQGDLDRLLDLIGPASCDLVLCHSVLEVVDDPAAAVATLAGTLRPGGAASILVANRAATVLARAIGGHLADAHRALSDADGRWGTQRRFDADGLTGLLATAGLTVESVHGVRVFADLVPGVVLDREPGAVEELRALELAASAVPPYRDIAAQLHVLARR